MNAPWNFDERRADELQARADADHVAGEEADEVARIEAHLEPPEPRGDEDPCCYPECGCDWDAVCHEAIQARGPAQVFAYEVSPSGLLVRDAGGVWRAR